MSAGEKPGYPRFKSRRRYRTLEIADPTAYMLKRSGSNYRVCVKGLPRLTLKANRELPDADNLKALRITLRGRRLYVDLVFKVDSLPQRPAVGPPVGLDMGVRSRVTLSTGEKFSRRERVSHFEKEPRLSRCEVGSRRWRTRRKILANARERESIRGRNETHRLTTELVRRHRLIALEDLSIRNMTASASGTVAHPGVNVRAKSGLNRSISDQTWGMIRQQLEYKAEWAGTEVVVVDPRGTSQTCSDCGYRDVDNRRGSEFRCLRCGLQMDADVNVALNILDRAINEAGGNIPPTTSESSKGLMKARETVP